MGVACVALVACVDLFHSTDFTTLCESAAAQGNPACGSNTNTTSDAAAPSEAADAGRTRPDFCLWTAEQARTEASRACAWLGACEGPLGESAFGPCVVRAQLAFNCNAAPSLRPTGAANALWGCLATVATCGEVDRCVFPGGVQPCIAVAGTSSACGDVGGNVAVRLECSGPAGRAAGVEPCILSGKTCSAENASTATCSGAKGFICGASECSGTSAVDCTAAGIRTFDRGIDCANFGGGVCLRADGGSVCAPSPTAPTCATESGPTCDDAGATTCSNSRESRVNCNAIGLPCDVTKPIAPYDLSAACVNRTAGACNVADACLSETQLKSCGRGGTFTVDCIALGLGKCKLGSSGRASCTAPNP